MRESDGIDSIGLFWTLQPDRHEMKIRFKAMRFSQALLL
jgi:hypothetical protein